MSTPTSAPGRRKSTGLPPKRGQIKAQIFQSIGKTIVSVVSKAGEVLGSNRGEGGSATSATTTPPPSAYNSDVN